MSNRLLRGLIGAVGVGVLLVGLRGVWVHRIDTRPMLGTHDLLAFWLGGALLHDLIVAPAAVGLALGLRRILPRPVLPWILGALIVSATTTLVAWPVLRGYGGRPDNLSILPRDELRGWIVTMALVWAVAVAGCLGTLVLGSRRRAGARD